MMKGGMGNLMKQAQMMQANMQKAQDELGLIDVEGLASNGLVKIAISCKHQVKKISIDPSVMNDHEMLEDLLIVAFKDALQKIEQATSAKMGNMMPPGMKLPF
ncbi:DNA_YbaB_EbfC, DNA-binding protein, YbaB/EbfC family [Candidatus Methylopumilus universalis]|uniref:YbaB/EbfC family nucleoid-associated protein n=1 Tax=Candidatus Methylopumilus universalis TaxID=2588536 RepID=UPI003BEF1D80